MILNSVQKGELKEVFDSLEEAFTAVGIDHYIIGAVARDIWYSKRNKTSRRTRDIDFAVLVGSENEYHAAKHYLREKKHFADTKSNTFVMIAPSGMEVDILPFGEFELDNSLTFSIHSPIRINVDGLMQVYQSGTKKIQIETGHKFKVATLPSIVLLKLIAFDDRPEKRSKDARDIANIMEHFFDLQADLIYDNHADLFTDEYESRSLQEIAAIVIGREINLICDSNEFLRERLKRILKGLINEKGNSTFLANMVAENGETVERGVRLLENILLPLS